LSAHLVLQISNNPPLSIFQSSKKGSEGLKNRPKTQIIIEKMNRYLKTFLPNFCLLKGCKGKILFLIFCLTEEKADFCIQNFINAPPKELDRLYFARISFLD
jgi:hypothetical protein